MTAEPAGDPTEFPYVFEAHDRLRWFLDHHYAPDADELVSACVRVGRITAVDLVYMLYYHDPLTREAAVASVGDVWSMSEYPDSHLDHWEWRELFDLAGYTEDGEPAQRPTAPLTLYRGSVPERKADWSWTDNRDVAAKYASVAHYYRPLGKVWKATVEPWRLLARNTGREEAEYVVNTDGLDIIEDDPRGSQG
jgi:hypothetical protein